MIRVSIVTATYNREDKLRYLYQSLLKQTNKNFDWIIIDDGSIDSTEEFINKLKVDDRLNIEYLKKNNGGKHTAINYFLDYSKLNNELIFFVDSDDFIKKNAVELILKHYQEIENIEYFNGLCFLKEDKKTKKSITPKFPKDIFDSDIFTLMREYKIYGDKAEVFFKSELAKYRFPIFDSEKFMSELYIWMELSKNKKIRFINKQIYVCEYLSDGYTKNFINILKKNKLGMNAYYKKIISEKRFGYIIRAKALIRLVQLKILAITEVEK